MNFQDMQNAVLSKGRLLGLSWGNTPTNVPNTPLSNLQYYSPQYQVQLYLNLGYQEFLSRTNAYPIAALQVQFPTQANVNSYPIRPVPANGPNVNPAALRIYEFVYQIANAQSRRVEQFSTARFRRQTNQYMNRLGSYSSWPQFWTQLFGRPQIDIWPGTVSALDTIYLTICPDPMTTSTSVPANLGGILVKDSDMPLMPPQFHMAPVYWAIQEMCDAANKPQQQQANQGAFEKLVSDALIFGSAFGEGDPEQSVIPMWDGNGI